MEHEHVRSPEQEHEPPQQAFDLEKLTSEQVGALIAALGAVYDSQPEVSVRAITPDQQVLALLANDLTAYAEHQPDKAAGLFTALAASDDNWTKRVALDQLAKPLLRQYANQPDMRQAVVDQWTTLFKDEDREVADTAIENLSETVYAANAEGWLEEAVLQDLDGKLPDGYRRLS